VFITVGRNQAMGGMICIEFFQNLFALLYTNRNKASTKITNHASLKISKPSTGILPSPAKISFVIMRSDEKSTNIRRLDLMLSKSFTNAA
jgi:hypothetical protein